ncbi:MAG: sialidase family protein [Candidatus Bathyarchaeia archaeon]
MTKIISHRTVVRDGWHNAFTDLCFWRGAYWLTYRRGSAHISRDGEIIVMRSEDLKRWRKTARLKTVGDDRDPKLCAVEDRLYVYFGTWLPKPEGWLDNYYGPLISHVAFTDDGFNWSNPIQAYGRNCWLWRVRYHNGVFYSAAYGWSDPREKHRSFLDLLVSDDGLNWRKHSRIAGEEDKPNEADLLFQGDGELWCIARSGRSPDHSLFYYSKPPYLEWGRIDLKITIHCPAFCKCGDKILVAGRRHMSAQWIPQDTPAGNTGIFVVKAHGAVEPFFALPSCGDAAYPGLISCDRDRIIISYYSQHAYLGGVIDGDISAPLNIADIYVAEIALE